MPKLSYTLEEADKIAFVGEHDIVKVGDVGVIEEVLTEEDKEFYRRTWGRGSGKDYKYQVNFNGTILIVSEEEVVPLSIALLLQL